MAKKRTPQELERIRQRKEFVQSNPELDPAEARKRFFVQTRVQELEKSGVEVTKERRTALRQKFVTGGVQRQGFYTAKDIAKYTSGGTQEPPINLPSAKQPEIRTNNVLASRKTTSTSNPASTSNPVIRASVETPSGYKGKSPAAGTLKYSKASYQTTKNLQKNAETYNAIVSGLTKKGISFEKAQEMATQLPGVYERTDKKYFEKSGAGKFVSNVKDELYAASGVATFREGQETRKTNEVKGLFQEALGVGVAAFNIYTLGKGVKGSIGKYNAKKFGVPQLGPGQTARFESKSAAALENKAAVEAAAGNKGPFLAEPVKVPYKVQAAQNRAKLQAQMAAEARTSGKKLAGPKATQAAEPTPTKTTVVKTKGGKGKGGKGKGGKGKGASQSKGGAQVPQSLAEVKATAPAKTQPVEVKTQTTKPTSATPSRVPFKNKFKSQEEFNTYWTSGGKNAYNVAPRELKEGFIKLNKNYIDAFNRQSAQRATLDKVREAQRAAEVQARNKATLARIKESQQVGEVQAANNATVAKIQEAVTPNVAPVKKAAPVKKTARRKKTATKKTGSKQPTALANLLNGRG